MFMRRGNFIASPRSLVRNLNGANILAFIIRKCKAHAAERPQRATNVLLFARAYYDRRRATIFREVIDVDQQTSTDGLEDQTESHVGPERHPITRENSPEETIRRMRSLPERADKLREAVRAIREANSR